MEQEQSQTIFTPPIVRVPQVSPREVAGNRRVYVPPRTDQLFPPQYAPRLQYAPISRQSPLQPSSSGEQPAIPPQTPRPPWLVPNRSARTGGIPLAQTGRITSVPRTPPFRIPGSSARPSRRPEPGVGETLLGCAILLFVGFLILAIAYFLLI